MTDTATTIEYPRIASRSEWLKARLELLEKEKAHTRAQDRLNTERRMLPMVEIDTPYLFEGPSGKRSLLELFEGRPQLIIYHFMWSFENGEPAERGCRSCSAWADEVARGHLRHLNNCGSTLALVSRAPYHILSPFKAQMGWQMPWYATIGDRFNYDFHVTIDPSNPEAQYNYRTRAEHEKAGTEGYFYSDQPFDLPGFSCFLRIEDKVYHTYSTYGRGCEAAGGSYNFLDLTALGRQEDWELPKGRNLGMGAQAGSPSIKYPDEYDDPATKELPSPSTAVQNDRVIHDSSPCQGGA